MRWPIGAHFVGDQVEQASPSRIVDYYRRTLKIAIKKAPFEFNFSQLRRIASPYLYACCFELPDWTRKIAIPFTPSTGRETGAIPTDKHVMKNVEEVMAVNNLISVRHSIVEIPSMRKKAP